MRELQKKQSDTSPNRSDIDQTIVDLDPDDQPSEKLRRRLLLRDFGRARPASGEARVGAPGGS